MCQIPEICGICVPNAVAEHTAMSFGCHFAIHCLALCTLHIPPSGATRSLMYTTRRCWTWCSTLRLCTAATTTRPQLLQPEHLLEQGDGH